jgi:hypothetical protein
MAFAAPFGRSVLPPRHDGLRRLARARKRHLPLALRDLQRCGNVDVGADFIEIEV